MKKQFILFKNFWRALYYLQSRNLFVRSNIADLPLYVESTSRMSESLSLFYKRTLYNGNRITQRSDQRNRLLDFIPLKLQYIFFIFLHSRYFPFLCVFLIIMRFRYMQRSRTMLIHPTIKIKMTTTCVRPYSVHNVIIQT